MTDLIEARKEILKFYSPFSFIRNIKDEMHVNLSVESLTGCETKKVIIDNEELVFFYKKMDWESDYFNRSIYKLFNVLYLTKNYSIIKTATEEFLKSAEFKKDTTIYIEVPPEDIKLIQALGENSFRLIETRLNYFNDNLKKYSYNRFNVRKVTHDDIGVLKEVAKTMRNDFDRFHSDQTFSVELADEYLATYIENSVLGFCDIVMVPNETNVSNEAFLTANYLKNQWGLSGCNPSKMVLSAVSKNCKGWYVKLISEMTYHLIEEGSTCIFMNTQATNKAVIKTWEALGYKYGNCVHVLSLTTK